MGIKPRTTQQVITIQRPGLWVLNFTLILCGIVVLLWIAYEYGRQVAGYDSAQADSYIQQLQEQLEESQAEIIETNRRATMLERNSQIDDGASEELKDVLTTAQQEVRELKKELSFYKSIVAPEQGDRSIAIQTIQLKRNEDGSYYYKIMVSQRGRNDLFARGTIDVSIEGVEKGQPMTLSLAKVSNVKKSPLKFGFKYFQNFEGELVLPETFQADYLHVKVNPKSSKIKALDEQFAWSDLTAGGA